MALNLLENRYQHLDTSMNAHYSVFFVNSAEKMSDKSWLGGMIVVVLQFPCRVNACVFRNLNGVISRSAWEYIDTKKSIQKSRHQIVKIGRLPYANPLRTAMIAWLVSWCSWCYDQFHKWLLELEKSRQLKWIFFARASTCSRIK